MNPKDAARNLREQSRRFRVAAEELNTRDPRSCSPEVIMAWCIELLELCASGKESNANLLDDLSDVAIFQVQQTSDESVMGEDQFGNFDTPPFEKDFFLGVFQEPEWWGEHEDMD